MTSRKTCLIVEGSPSRSGTGSAFPEVLRPAVRTEPGVQPFCLKTLAVWALTVLSSGSVNWVRLDVVSWVPCPEAAVGRRASMPRVLETTTFLPTVAIPEGK